MPDFQPYPKTPRLFRDIVVTEKIDGTNAAIQIYDSTGTDMRLAEPAFVTVDDRTFGVVAQSRKRLITPVDDNFGFARWVHDNALDLVNVLGLGTHYGEWWGNGIQRGYGLAKGDKQFSLFNTKRWNEENVAGVPGLGVVPTLYEGPFSESSIRGALWDLSNVGSYAAPGFDRPEGIVVYHDASNQTFKVLLENDELPKGLVA